MGTTLEPGLRILLRLEGLALAAAGLAGIWSLSTPWWQVAVFALLPDVSIAGYAFGPKAGARFYNIAHTYLAPGMLAVLGWSLFPGLLPIACIWLAHIGIDRALGYGLKSETSFRITHLGRIGRTA